MARMRMLKPSFFTNDALAEVHPLGRLLFQGLWCIADREGRLEDRPRRIKAEILPYDEVDVDYLLNELDRREFILRYTVDDARYIQVRTFTKHQTPHIRESASTIPAPDKHCAEHMPGTVLGTVPAPLKSLTDTDTGTDTVMEIARPSGSRAPAAGTPPDNITPLPVAAEEKPSANGHKRVDPIFDALVELMGYTPSSRSERSGWGKCVKELKEAVATPEEIAIRGARYAEKYDRDRLTVHALVKHWGEMAQDSQVMVVAPPSAARMRNATKSEPPVELPEPEPLPDVSLTFYQEAPKLWGTISAELRKALGSQTRFDTAFGGARLMLPQREVPPGIVDDLMPTLVLHSRASLEQSDRYGPQIAAAFGKVAPHIQSLRRVCRAQVISVTVADSAPEPEKKAVVAQ